MPPDPLRTLSLAFVLALAFVAGDGYALALAAAGADVPSSPGIYFEDGALCGLEKPAVDTTFRNPAHLPRTPRFLLVLSQAARDFGVDEQSLLLIQRRLGGIILIDVPITVTAVPERDAVYEVVPARELLFDDYSFAIKKDLAIVFFGCGFTTLP
jgi:hypothetical protein